MITQARLKELMTYDKDTGIFTRKKATALRHTVGEIVGVNHKSGYLKCGIDNKEYLLHRLAWLYEYGEMPKKMIDHINQNKADNRLCNLKDVSNSENLRNMRKSKSNKSGFTGVYYDKARDKWKANIYVNGKTLTKRFKDKYDAISQRKIWNKEYGYSPNHGRDKMTKEVQ